MYSNFNVCSYDPDYIFVNLWVYTNILNLDAQLADDNFLHLIVSFQIKEQCESLSERTSVNHPPWLISLNSPPVASST